MEQYNTYIRRRECEAFDYCMKNVSGPLFILDVETTGTKPQSDRIIQLSVLKLERKERGQYRIVSFLDQYIRPEFPVPKGASDVNHITNEFLADKPSETEAFPVIREYLKEIEEGSGVVLGYCNKRFDNIMMDKMYLRQAGISFQPAMSLDIKLMAEELVKRKDLPEGRMTLTNVGELYGIKEDTMHNAMTDIMVTGKIAFRLYEEYRDHYYGGSYKGKPRIMITNMYEFKKSRIVDFVIITGTLLTPEGRPIVGKIRYNRYEKCYEEIEGELFRYGDLDQFEQDANLYAGGDIGRFHSARRKT